jgi:hypothetical protein
MFLVNYFLEKLTESLHFWYGLLSKNVLFEYSVNHYSLNNK